MSPGKTGPGASDGGGRFSEGPLGRGRLATTIKHNPALMPPEVLEATFAARDGLLLDLLRRVQENTTRAAIQHLVIVGPRGSGKTTLLRMLELRVLRDPVLAKRWLPVAFAEEEFGIYDLKDFFLAVLERAGADDWPSLRQEVAELASSDPRGAIQVAIGRVENLAKEGRRLLLLVENIDQILQQLSLAESTATSHLRLVLQQSSAFMVVGTTASVFEELVNYQRPLYQFFAPILLTGLDAGGALELLKKRAAVDGVPILGERPADVRRQVRVITELSAGNPRLVVGLYDVLTGRPIGEVMDTFTRLMDELTPYYRSRLQELPAQQRKLLDELIRLGGAATPTQLAQGLGTKPNVVNAQLARLREAKWVRSRRTRDRRSRQYVIAEEMFRLWYEMRYRADARQRYSFLARFFQSYFAAEDLVALRGRLLSELELFGRRLPYGVPPSTASDAVFEAHVSDVCSRLSTVRAALPTTHLEYEVWKEVDGLITAGRLEQARRLVETSRENHERSNSTLSLAHDEFLLGMVSHSEGQLQRALLHAKNAARLGADEPELVVDSAIVLRWLGDRAGAEEILRQFVARNPNNVLAAGSLGSFLLSRGNAEEAIALFEQAIEQKLEGHAMAHFADDLSDVGMERQAESLFVRALSASPDDAFVVAAYGAFLAARQRGESGAHIDHAMQLAGERAGFIARYVSSKLQVSEQFAAAEDVLRRALEKQPDDVLLRCQLADVLQATDRLSEATELLGGTKVPVTLQNSRTVERLARALVGSGQLVEAEALLREGVKQYPGHLTYIVALGQVLREKGDIVGAVEVLRDAVAKDPASAAGHLELAEALAAQGDFGGAESAFRLSLDLVPTDLSATIGLGTVLYALGRPAEGDRVLESATLLATEAEPRLQRANRQILAVRIISSLPITLRMGGAAAVDSQLERVLVTISTIPLESQHSYWFAFLISALREGMRGSDFERLLARVANKIPSAAGSLEVFRAAALASEEASNAVVDGIPEDVRRAAEKVLQGMDRGGSLIGGGRTQ